VGPCVDKELSSQLLGDVLEATLEVGVSRGTSGLCVGSADELESLGGIEFLHSFQITLGFLTSTLYLTS
jgi:hypothetical protein